MALSLRAEQKNITNLFNSGEDIYVIPEYQRPYSWNTDTCYQFFTDITNAFLDGKDYFVGNIIMARSNMETNKPNVVDGQQRLITLWLFIKVLTVLHPDKSRLVRLLEVESVLSDNSLSRIDSKVYEHDDQKNIESVLSYTLDTFKSIWQVAVNSKQEVLDEKKYSRIEANVFYLFKWMSEFYNNLGDSDKKTKFLIYFLEHVYLLPIELDGKDIYEASDRALTIFETINNRGQVLEDSDIFKARLYKSAQAEGKGDEFIERWLEFNAICSDLKISVDDLFRYYYHILRGKEGVTTNEGSLREYLTRDSNSALSAKPYKEVVDDLSSIANILQWLNAPEKMNCKIAQMVQLISQYTNQYPKYALVNYAFTEGIEDEEKLLKFLKRIVKYYYYRGATIQVKYETYRINKLVAKHQKIEPYDCSDISDEYFDHLGLLRNGYALLAHYLLFPDKYESNVFYDKIIYGRDFEVLPYEWHTIPFDEINNNIANIVVLDIPKRSLNLKAKMQYYSQSKLSDVHDIFCGSEVLTSRRFFNREKRLKSVLLKFFKNTQV